MVCIVLGDIQMKIIICEEDYSYIEKIHSTLLKYTKIKGINAEFILTTRKPASIVDFLINDQAECYYISLDLQESMSAIELITLIRLKNPRAIINVLSNEVEKLENPELDSLGIKRKILKAQTTSMADDLRKSLFEVYQQMKAADYFA